MGFDPELFKKLIGTFKTELNEQLQIITDGLLALEQGKPKSEALSSIFRAAHNIKGTSRSLGISYVDEIAHQIETLFSFFQEKNLSISAKMTDLCLEAVDKIALAMQCFMEKKPLPFDLTDLLKRLSQVGLDEGLVDKQTNRATTQDSQPPIEEQSIEQVSDVYDSIRVSIANIDHVSALIDEIQISKILFENHYLEFANLTQKINQFSVIWRNIGNLISENITASKSENFLKLSHQATDHFTEILNHATAMQKNFQLNVNHLSIVSNGLQEEIRTLRLVPAANLLSTIPRYVRDLSQELNKKVTLKIIGEEVKLDKMVLEKLKDPIIHILRNSIDHGIEPPEIRQSLGKPEVGQIEITIREEGGKIHISISDDGAGIDLNKVIDLAKRKNLVSTSELEKMSEKQSLELIFRQGFSTKEIITDISGRGIGLDIVKTNIANLNGQLNLQTEIGKGTLFDLSVPLTLASERGLVIACANQFFVIPISSIHSVLAIQANDIFNVEGIQSIMLADHPVSLHRLSVILDLETRELNPQEQLFAVVLTIGWNTIAILVDQIIGERDIVIKPLTSPLTNALCVAGGTLSDTNKVMMVLNPNDLIKIAGQSSETKPIFTYSDKTKVMIKPSILVVDDSITTRTLEKNILESKNYDVTVAVNGKEAWDLLQTQSFSLLITDIVMPIMDGFTLTEQVKQNEKLRGLPVIIVTSLDSDAEKKRGIDVGADAYLVKNEFESGALLDIVEQLV